MKLRITSDELRLRLSADDIAKLATGVGLRETLALPNRLVHFELACEGSVIDADFAQDTIKITVPVAEAVRWSVSNEDTLSAVLAQGCRVAVEKDKHG